MDKFKGFNINVIILVIFIVIAVFFSAQYIIKIYNIEKPVKDDILALEEIKDVSTVDNDDKIDLLVEFHPGIDFYKTYQKISDVMQERLGEKSGRIIFTEDDKEIEELENIYYDLHYSVYQGINTGHFVEMEKNIEDIVQLYEVDNYKIWVSNNAIYIQLDKDNNSLYKRIPYNNIAVSYGEGDSYG